MAQGRWVKDFCPYAKDQGFYSVIGDVAPGEKVFGFTHTLTGSGTNALVLKTETNGLVTEMADKNYRVLVTKSVTGSIVPGAEALVALKTKSGFSLFGTQNSDYDIIVIGRVLY
jgi:hypothetical protein